MVSAGCSKMAIGCSKMDTLHRAGAVLPPAAHRGGVSVSAMGDGWSPVAVWRKSRVEGGLGGQY